MSFPYLAHAVVETAKISFPTVVDSFTGRVSEERSTARLRSWSRNLLGKADVQLEISGRENIAPRQSYVIMSNHQSLYDIPILFEALPLDFRMAAKAELFWVPIWGRAMLAAGFVRVDRKRGAEARAELLRRGRELESRGMSLWIAPEGTRSPDGQLLPFKSGGFHLALGLGLPILPVRIDGAYRILAKGRRTIAQGQKVKVAVLPPLGVGSWLEGEANADVRFERAAERLRSEVRALLERPPGEVA